ncbi:PH domain-containing protein [Marilutibacter chinensis]|uniref:PH domain-containing protein n=1 Tax=Marilutibacter chinensis TaxID=2912247 RepID=A0ABS9HSH6_9GAMM|nr:PH domain-containing protein [Lysobacter chinensis]MCF7221105.1 PH domain-containing protein [Lysobacter chinensis]
MSSPDTRDFPSAPLAHRTTWFFPALWVLIVIVAYMTPSARPATTEPVPPWLITPFACALVVIGPFILLQYRRIRVEGGALRVMAASVFTHTIAIADLDLERARIVNLDEHPEYRPWLRLFGMSLPGFTAGHCLLRNRTRAFCLLTDRERVLVLPQRNGRYLLLSPERPQAMLSQLRELAGNAPRN